MSDVTLSPTLAAFLEFLVSGRIISQKDRDGLLKTVSGSGSYLRDAIQSRDLMTDAVFSTFLAFYLRLPLVDVSQVKVEPDALRCVPEDVARSEYILPIEVHGSILRVAIDGLPGLLSIRRIAAESNLTLELAVATSSLRPLVERSYAGEDG